MKCALFGCVGTKKNFPRCAKWLHKTPASATATNLSRTWTLFRLILSWCHLHLVHTRIPHWIAVTLEYSRSSCEWIKNMPSNNNNNVACISITQSTHFYHAFCVHTYYAACVSVVARMRIFLLRCFIWFVWHICTLLTHPVLEYLAFMDSSRLIEARVQSGVTMPLHFSMKIWARVPRFSLIPLLLLLLNALRH